MMLLLITLCCYDFRYITTGDLRFTRQLNLNCYTDRDQFANLLHFFMGRCYIIN